MLNSVNILGKIRDVFDLTDCIMATIECNDELYYIYWEKTADNGEDLRNKNVSVEGELSYIKVRKNEEGTVRRLLAVYVRRLEVYDF